MNFSKNNEVNNETEAHLTDAQTNPVSNGMNEEINIISVGGSLIVPNEINLIFLDKFREFIIKETQAGKRFIIIAGGGWTAREYQNAAKKMGNPTDFDLDMLGIHATRINAFLLKTVLSDLVHPEIILNPSEKIDFEEKVLVAAEENPGAEATSDYGAVKIAEYVGTKTIINLTNVNYVFDKNPKDYPDAKPIREMNWERFFEILPEDWSSGDHAPFGPKAAKRAKEKGIDVVIIGGGNLGELSKFLNGEKFEGTLISDKTN